MIIRLAHAGKKTRMLPAVKEGVYNGRCMDRIYEEAQVYIHDVRRIVLQGVPLLCWVEGFQEFVFDLLTNFPNIGTLSIELVCFEGHEADALFTMLMQFHEVYPDRNVGLTSWQAIGDDEEHLTCDLAGLQLDGR